MFLQIACLLLISTSLVAGQDCLSGHNNYRQRHGVPPLEHDHNLEMFALKRANYMAATDIFGHPRNLPYGENLYWKSGRIPSCGDALDMWYNEIKWYNFNSGSFSPSTGHFTQMVWKNTQYVGCASSRSRRTGRIYIACNYYPAGNVYGQFKANVPYSKYYYKYYNTKPNTKPNTNTNTNTNTNPNPNPNTNTNTNTNTHYNTNKWSTNYNYNYKKNNRNINKWTY